MPDNGVAAVVRQFAISEPIHLEEFRGRGNINLESYFVQAGPEGEAFLLQRLNTDVFPFADRVMRGMEASLRAQQAALASVPRRWEVPELIPTHEGHSHLDWNGQVWRMMRYIGGTVSFKSLEELPVSRRLETAREVGRGLATYCDLTASIAPEDVATALPGYRDTRLYFHLLDAALEGCRTSEAVGDRMPQDPEVRAAAERHFYCALDEDERLRRKSDPQLAPFIDLALSHRARGMLLQEAREEGAIRQRAIHGDTKIENFLFDAQTGEVVALVDLDTVMPHTWLADWGDMVRSLANVAGERERDLSRVRVNRDVYQAVLAGFLRTTTTATPEEIAMMPRAVQAIALELGVRFLADYLRGDTYFQLGPGDPEDLNKVRALVQLELFRQLMDHEAEADALVKELSQATV